MDERSIFMAALERESAPERSAYLDEACGGDTALRQRVEALLTSHQQAGSFLRMPVPERLAEKVGTPAPLEEAGGDAPATEERPRPLPEGQGSRIGPYKLLQELGEGGMGTVWMAEQTQPVQRKVALKIIKPGMDSRQVIARFEAERQALALMDHPNIASVHDGGTTASGRPYFVMELVKGVPITKFCDEQRLTPRQRLELFVPVCQAVQHAHQKGLIHRDLKPSNVLVCLYDGRPVPKVIDFGVAKAAAQKLTKRTMLTEVGQVVGTLEYMSPEQAELNQLDIDTRSDIYSLGVLLYELLTGSTPLDKKRLKEAAFMEVLRVIREEEPPKPSTRLSTTEQLPSIAANRGLEPKKLSAMVRGELDWIVLKALDKDRNRRYETANGFAMDIQRYLADEPVHACPPSASYRLRKFVWRHKRAVLTALVVLVALIGGVIGTTWQLVRAERAVAAEKAANEMTNKRLTQIEKGNEILAGIFADLEVQEVNERDRPLEAILAERLVQGADQLEGDSVGDPLAVAALQERLGRSLMSLGFADRAIPILQKSRQTRQEILGRDHPDTLSTTGILAQSYQDTGKLDLALSLLEETLPLTRSQLGADHRDTLGCMNCLGETYMHLGKNDLALPLLEETLRLRKARFGPDDPFTISSMNNLAVAYEFTGRYDLSLPLKEKTLRLEKAQFGPDHPKTVSSMNNLAEGYRTAGRLDLALPLIEETFTLAKTRLGPYHPITLISMNNLGMDNRLAGKLDQARPLLEEAFRLMKVKLGPDHFNTLSCMANLADCYRDMRKLDLALPLYREGLERTGARFGLDNPRTLRRLQGLGAAYWSLHQLDKSVPTFEDLVKRRVAILGRQHPDTLEAIANLGVNYASAGRLDQALPLLEEGYQASKTIPTLRWVGTELLGGYIEADKTIQAAALAKELVADARRALPPNSAQLAAKLAQITFHLLKIKAYADAEPVLQECLTIRIKTQPDDWTTFNTQSLLGGALLGQQKYAAAESLLLAGYEGMKKREKTIPLDSQARLAEAADRLVAMYTATKKSDELKKWQAERAKYPQTSPPQIK
jgi:serine/threonine protein kinase/tetratricopeptide (TPR) repeat protein